MEGGKERWHREERGTRTRRTSGGEKYCRLSDTGFLRVCTTSLHKENCRVDHTTTQGPLNGFSLGLQMYTHH